MGVRYPCKICKFGVKKNHKAVHCDRCEQWVHIKCNQINKETYNNLMNNNEIP